MQRAGLPDIIGCYKGRFFAIEVKMPDTSSQLSPLQKVILRRVARSGGVPVVARSVTDAVGALDKVDEAETELQTGDL